MLLPKKVKFRKWHKMRKHPSKLRVETRGVALSFGSFGLKAVEAGRLRSQHLEAARKAMSRELKKTGKIWIRVFPDFPYTAKPPEVGMGKGKGDPQGYQIQIKPGRVLFEIDGVQPEQAKATLRRAAAKLPVKTTIVERHA